MNENRPPVAVAKPGAQLLLRLERHFFAACMVAFGLSALASLGFKSIREFQLDSETLVLHSVRHAALEGPFAQGGFMWAPSGGPYYSQFGLHYKVLALIGWPIGASEQGLSALRWGAKFAAMLAFAAVLAWFLNDVRKQYGHIAAWLALGLAATSAPLLEFAWNVYWLTALSFVPFVYAWTRHDPRKPWRTAVVVGAVVLVKSLCGYEYLSSIIAAAMVAAFHREWRQGVATRTVVGHLAAIWLAGVLGFVLAFASNLWQAAHWLGGLERGLAAVLESARYRTVGDPLGLPPPLWRDLASMASYLLAEGQPWILKVAILALTGEWLLARRTQDRGQATLWSWTLFGAFLASMSWNLLARGHMRHHGHINFITLYLPFNLLVFAHAGSVAQRLVDGFARARKATPDT